MSAAFQTVAAIFAGFSVHQLYAGKWGPALIDFGLCFVAFLIASFYKRSA